jgi:hypothetical protein
VDAPQLPGAETSADSPAGPAAPGQASAFRRALDNQAVVEATAAHPAGLSGSAQTSAFRRALDVQAVAEDPGGARVRCGALDLTIPLDLGALRAALALDGADEALPNAQVPARLPAQVPPSAAPATVSAPTLLQHATPTDTPTQPTPPDPPDDDSSAPLDNGRIPARLPTALLVCAVLAALAGAALIVIDHGGNGGPLAPTALPAKASTRPASGQAMRPAPGRHSYAAPPPPSAAPPKPASPSPSTSPSASPSATGPHFGVYLGSTGAIVVDIQRRLADLGFLYAAPDGSTYRDSGWTLSEVQQQRGPDPDGTGYYGKATDFAIMAFKRHFLDNDQGPVPAGGCDIPTYARLHLATADNAS